MKPTMPDVVIRVVQELAHRHRPAVAGAVDDDAAAGLAPALQRSLMTRNEARDPVTISTTTSVDDEHGARIVLDCGVVGSSRNMYSEDQRGEQSCRRSAPRTT